MKAASEKVKKDRIKEAKEVKDAKQKPEGEVKVVKVWREGGRLMGQKEECFTTVKGPDGEEMTIQTKPVDSKGNAPVEEKVVKVEASWWVHSVVGGRSACAELCTDRSIYEGDEGELLSAFLMHRSASDSPTWRLRPLLLLLELVRLPLEVLQRLLRRRRRRRRRRRLPM